MKELHEIDYFPPSEKLVDILCKKTQNDSPLFFRVLTSYYFAKIASMMRCNIQTHDRGVIPVSMYAMNLAISGSGKGFSTNIIEEKVINLFREKFLNETFPKLAEKNIAELAIKRAHRNTSEEDKELEALNREFNTVGELAFSFDSGTTAAVKQMRHKLLMANAGSMNLEMDEVGSNLLGNVDVLTTFLELFDVGKVKQKLVKNTAENKRTEEIEGRTPTNLMLFGTPSKLLDGGKVEDEFKSFLETGYARRCIFGYNKEASLVTHLTPEEIYDNLTDTSSDVFLNDLSIELGKLANVRNFGIDLTMTKEVSLLLIEYKIACDTKASKLGEHEEVLKAEMSHRYFKCLKQAGAFAFIDQCHEITEDHLYASIKLVEESGIAFEAILSRPKNYERLANYIAAVGKEMTHIDLIEELPFYKGNEAQRREMMTLAISYGYRNNIIIKRLMSDGIEFLKGESLNQTDIDEMVISYSTDITTGYSNEMVPFDELHKLTQEPGFHFVSHHLLENT